MSYKFEYNVDVYPFKKSEESKDKLIENTLRVIGVLGLILSGYYFNQIALVPLFSIFIASLIFISIHDLKFFTNNKKWDLRVW